MPEQMGSGVDARYEISEELGRGGMGIVYRARDRETGELVAVKVLKPEISADAASVDRFKTELRMARKITHRNVCRIYEFSRVGGTAYISMELVEGETLRSILNRFGTLSFRKGIEIARQVCAGLREAHAQGVIHRDLKPQNVMVDASGNAKIMDFGIARPVEAGATTTAIVGTPAYMAPEQAEGGRADQRSDIYAFGLVLYEMFTGTRAFDGETPVTVLVKQIHENPIRPRDLEPTLPVGLEGVILKCLEKSPAKRYQSIDELERGLDQSIEPARSAPSPPGPRSPGQPRKVARLRWLALVSFAVAVGSLVALLSFRGREEPMRHTGPVNCVAFSHEGLLIASGSEDKTVKLWDAASGKLVRTLIGHTRAVLALAFSPDGRRLASGGVDRSIRIWDVQKGQELQPRIMPQGRVTSLTFTPDGALLVSAGGCGDVTNWDPSSGKKLLTFKAHDDAIDEIAVSPDGKLLATGSADETVRLWRIGAGEAQRIIHVHADEVTTVAFAPKLPWLASAGYDKVIKIWDAGTGEEVHRLEGHKDAVNHVTFSPDGILLASASDDNTVKIWRVEDEQCVRTLNQDDQPYTTVAFSPNGKQVAAAGYARTIRVWDVATGKKLH